MNDQVITLGVGTTLPYIVCALQSEEGTAVDLATASSVVLNIENPRSGVTWTKSCTIVSTSQGIVSCETTTDLTVEPAELLARFRVTFASGRQVDVPNEGYLRLRVS